MHGSAALQLRLVVLPTDSPWAASKRENSDPTVPLALATGVVVDGACQVWKRPLHPFFAELPRETALRADACPRLGALVLASSLMEQEIRANEPCTDTIVRAMRDVVLISALRQIAADRGERGYGRYAPVAAAVDSQDAVYPVRAAACLERRAVRRPPARVHRVRRRTARLVRRSVQR